MENLKRNGLDARTTAEEVAVGEEEGRVTLHLSRKIGHHSIAAANTRGTEVSVPVPLVSLDAYLTSRRLGAPDIIKIDAQGYDGFILRGAKNTLKQAWPTLFVEFAPFHLENCEFGRSEFLDLIFAGHPDVFLVDDRRVRRCSKQDVLLISDARVFHVDLLAVARPEHLRIIEESCARLKAPPLRAP
jgi:FkbM family methyltransferase